MRVVQISDTHLPAAGGVIAGNLDLVVEFINETLRPDLVVHSGDIVAVSPDDREDREAALLALGSLRAPLLVVPGNHDVGEVGHSPWMGIGVTSERIAAHGRAVNETPFLEPLGEWGLVGLNSELFGSGLPEEDAQWKWLERTLADPAGGPLLLFTHRPLWAPDGAPATATIPATDRLRLLALPGAERLRAAGSGHLHYFRRRPRPELLEVWAPSIAFAGDEELGYSEFTQSGVVEWVLEGDRAEARFRAPLGLDERSIWEVPEFVASMEGLRR